MLHRRLAEALIPTGHPAGIVFGRLGLDAGNLNDVGRVLTVAFTDDPSFSFLMPNSSARRPGLRIYFASATIPVVITRS